MNNITENIIKKIKAGELSMQPRWHFVLRTALMLFGVFLIALAAVYLFSFVLFILHKSGLWLAPQFGVRGVMLLVVGSPWLILSLLGMFLLVLYVLVSHYSFSYRKPLVYSMIGVVLFVIVVSSVIQYFGVHERMQTFVEQRGVPGLSSLYRGQGERRPDGVVVGTIIEIADDTFILTTDRDEQITVRLTGRTKVQPTLRLQVGSEVLVFGDRNGTTVEAFGLKSASDGQFRRGPASTDMRRSPR